MAAPPPPPVAPPPPVLAPPPPILTPPPARLVPGSPLTEFHSPEDEVRHCCRELVEGLSENERLLSFYSPIPSVIQQEKVCGLVALEMALSSDQFPHHPTSAQLLEEARRRGFTKQGEMFSAENLAHLARDVGCCHCDVTADGLGDHVTLLSHVTRGWPVLVPYDVGADNRPASHGGRKAHWAVIAGAVLRLPSSTEPPEYSVADPEISNLQHCQPRNSAKIDFSAIDIAQIFLLGKQGKSRYLGLWSYRTMMESNRNLMNLPDFIAGNMEDFVIPQCGIEGGLNARVIWIRP